MEFVGDDIKHKSLVDKRKAFKKEWWHISDKDFIVFDCLKEFPFLKFPSDLHSFVLLLDLYHFPTFLLIPCEKLLRSSYGNTTFNGTHLRNLESLGWIKTVFIDRVEFFYLADCYKMTMQLKNHDSEHYRNTLNMLKTRDICTFKTKKDFLNKIDYFKF